MTLTYAGGVMEVRLNGHIISVKKPEEIAVKIVSIRK